MVADAALWLILVLAILFLWCGCRMTRRPPKVSKNAADLPGTLDHTA